MQLPLADIFRRLIKATGPISLSQFMGESNARYYASRDPLGAEGDFITAPEISQMFGELLGLWLTDIWQRAGAPEKVHYLELGPGRGTLAHDALGAMRKHGLNPQVHLVEGSPALRKIQGQLLPEAQFHDDLASVPNDAPLLVLANEFFDALPIRQLVRTKDGWREHMIGLVDEEFAFVAGRLPLDAAIPEVFREAEIGTVLETCPAASVAMHELCARLGAQGGAALLIDYGHDAPRTGSTLQAIRQQQKVEALALPGEADLTTHVDFAMLAEAVEASNARWLGTTTQGAFLKALGIDIRAAALAKRAPHYAPTLERVVHRLTDETQMGELFKVMGVAGPHWPDGAVFTRS